GDGLCQRAVVTGLCWVNTSPEVRRQGMGTAMTLAPLQEAHAQGLTTGVLQAPLLSQPLYRALGFATYCTFVVYTWPTRPARLAHPCAAASLGAAQVPSGAHGPGFGVPRGDA